MSAQIPAALLGVPGLPPEEDDVPTDVPPLSETERPQQPPPYDQGEDFTPLEAIQAPATVVNVAPPTKTPSARGVRTSEFSFTAVLALVVVVCATVLLALDKISDGQWVDVISMGAGVPASAFALSRGLTKLGTGTHANDSTET